MRKRERQGGKPGEWLGFPPDVILAVWRVGASAMGNSLEESVGHWARETVQMGKIKQNTLV